MWLPSCIQGRWANGKLSGEEAVESRWTGDTSNRLIPRYLQFVKPLCLHLLFTVFSPVASPSGYLPVYPLSLRLSLSVYPLPMNYILHLNHTFNKMADDERLSPPHISLYMALFLEWNAARFLNPLYISSAELMRAAKIRNKDTYGRTLHQLHAWGYLTYQPTRSKYTSSTVSMLDFSATDPKDEGGTGVGDTVNPPFLPFHSLVTDPENGVGEQVGSNAGNKTYIIENNTNILNPSNYQTLMITPDSEKNEPGVFLKKMEKDFPENISPEFSRKTGNEVREEFAENESIGNEEPIETPNDFLPVRAEEKEKVAAKRKRAEHPFCKSEFADLSVFVQAFENTDYAHANLLYYHAAIANWRDKTTGEPPLRRDWLATARTFMLNDIKAGKLVLSQHSSTQNLNPHAHTQRFHRGAEGIDMQEVFSLIDAHYPPK
jgi:hypothetical protein